MLDIKLVVFTLRLMLVWFYCIWNDGPDGISRLKSHVMCRLVEGPRNTGIVRHVLSYPTSVECFRLKMCEMWEWSSMYSTQLGKIQCGWKPKSTVNLIQHFRGPVYHNGSYMILTRIRNRMPSSVLNEIIYQVLSFTYAPLKLGGG